MKLGLWNVATHSNPLYCTLIFSVKDRDIKLEAKKIGNYNHTDRNEELTC
jgi:hypothetical protein